jgi:hypothetical protein
MKAPRPTLWLIAIVAAGAVALPTRAYFASRSAPPQPAPLVADPGTARVHSTARPVDPALPARAAAKALFAAKHEFAAKCWTPLLAAQPEPPRTQHRVRVTFDGTGTEIRRQIEDVAGATRADVARCLRELPLELRIAAFGQPATVSVMLSFP